MKSPLPKAKADPPALSQLPNTPLSPSSHFLSNPMSPPSQTSPAQATKRHCWFCLQPGALLFQPHCQNCKHRLTNRPETITESLPSNQPQLSPSFYDSGSKKEEGKVKRSCRVCDTSMVFCETGRECVCVCCEGGVLELKGEIMHKSSVETGGEFSFCHPSLHISYRLATVVSRPKPSPIRFIRSTAAAVPVSRYHQSTIRQALNQPAWSPQPAQSAAKPIGKSSVSAIPAEAAGATPVRRSLLGAIVA